MQVQWLPERVTIPIRQKHVEHAVHRAARFCIIKAAGVVEGLQCGIDAPALVRLHEFLHDVRLRMYRGGNAHTNSMNGINIGNVLVGIRSSLSR